MSWTIALLENNVKVSKECAKELFEVLKNDVWYEESEVIDSAKNLTFNYDHAEGMDFLASEPKVIKILKSYKVKGDICFGSVEGDNAGEFWGYRFDGKGGFKKLNGEIIWK